MVEARRHLWRSSNPTPCSKQEQPEGVAKGCGQLCFDYLKDGGYLTVLHNLLQHLTMLTVKKKFLLFKGNLPYFSLWSLPLVHLLGTTERSLAPITFS